YWQRIVYTESYKDRYYIESDGRPTLDRLHDLVRILSFTDCGTQYSVAHKEMLLPLYQAIHEEALRIAASPFEQRTLRATQMFIDLLESGSNRSRDPKNR